MLVLLLLVVLLGLLAWGSNSNAIKAKQQRAQQAANPLVSMDDLRQAHQQWIDFIAAYAAVAKTKSEKALVARMLSDIKTQQGGEPTSVKNAPAITGAFVVDGKTSLAAQESGVPSVQAIAELETYTPKHQAAQVDNSSLLLYFGAFLFVASAGLFVAFGGAPGLLKVFIMLLVTAVMYNSGLWLYRNRPKLRQAGQAFVGIGIVLAPLVGASLYTYAFNSQHGFLVWLLTSLFCLGLYIHALRVFRTTLMGYIFMFTFLSLFESGVGITGVPTYFYGWGLAAFGILLQLMDRWRGWKGWPPELREVPRNGSQLFLPVAVLISLVMAPSLGAVQLGVSLLLAAAFYSLQIGRSVGETQQSNAVVAQSAMIAGFASLAYGYGHHLPVVVACMILVNGLQVLALLRYGATEGSRKKLWQNYGGVLQVATVVSVLIAVSRPTLLLITTAAAVVIGGAVWWRQHRPEAYMLASLAWMGLPFIYGQLLLPSITPEVQAFAGLTALVVLLLTYLSHYPKSRNVTLWTDYAGVSYEVGVLSIVITSFFAGPYFCLAVGLALVGMSVVLAENDKRNDWAELAALALIAPLIRSWSEPKDFLMTTLVVLAILIALSLRYRREALRWASTLVWLLLPYAMGRGALGSYWPPAGYAWAYVVSMIGLIISRAIARGRFFLSSKVPLSTMMRSASMSYVVGYISAAVLALGVSLYSDHSRLHTSLILAVMGLTIIVLNKVVERRDDILALLPFVLQGLVLSSIRPEQAGHALNAFLLTSTVVSLLVYVAADRLKANRPDIRLVAQAALITVFVTPAAILFAPTSWPMPVGLFVGGCLLVRYAQSLSRGYCELAGGVIALSIMWFLHWAGVHELQAYTHVLIVLFIMYASWRDHYKEIEQANNYLWLILFTATVPLALEALNSTTHGSLYGWWLLLEEIAIMLYGMTVRRRFVTMWGLYVAVGAVLYQLRGLGYAALAFLALFLIGLAVFRLQQNDKNDPDHQ